MVQQKLDDLCETFSGVRTLAFVDLGVGMVLVTNSAVSFGQDVLNDMCREASAFLDSGASAMTGTQDTMNIFLRASNEQSDALCCVCGPETDFASFLPAAQTCLDEISSDGAANDE